MCDLTPHQIEMRKIQEKQAFIQVIEWIKAMCQVGIGDGYALIILHEGEVLATTVDAAMNAFGLPVSIATNKRIDEIVAFIEETFDLELETGSIRDAMGMSGEMIQ